MKTNLESGVITHRMDAIQESVTRTPPRAPVRAMRVLEALSHTKDGMSLASISIALELPKTSAMHLLRSLETAGYVRRTPSGFVLGAASYSLAARIGGVDDIDNAVLSVLQDVTDATQETVLIGTFTEDRRSAIYTKRVPSPQAVRFTPEVGGQRPLYASGIGKLLLAYAPEEFVTAYLRKERLTAVTTRTITTRRMLLERLEKIQKEGLAYSIDELAEGGSAIAAPVFDADGKVEKALVIAAPTARLLLNKSVLADATREGAKRLSSLFGYKHD